MPTRATRHRIIGFVSISLGTPLDRHTMDMIWIVAAFLAGSAEAGRELAQLCMKH